MNCERDCACCFASFWYDALLEFDNNAPRECCFGCCEPCKACLRECTCCEWCARCARPVVLEVCPDTSDAVHAARTAEPCTATGHACVALIRCVRGAVCGTHDVITKAAALLQVLALVALATVWWWWPYTRYDAAGLAQQALRGAARAGADTIKHELENVTLTTLTPWHTG